MSTNPRYVTFWNGVEPRADGRPDLEEFPDARPSFATETWPLIESKRSSITGLFYWKRRARPLLDRFLRSQTPIKTFFRLPNLIDMHPTALDCVFTAADSEMGLFFETNDQWFLRQLCSLWPHPGIMRVGRERLGQLNDEDFELLCQAVAAIPPEHVWFTFDDEGWLLYVFGPEGLLSWVQANRGYREQAENRVVVLRPETETPE